MSTTIGGVRIADMPDLGAVNDASSFVGERAGSGRFGAPAFKSYATTGLATSAAVLAAATGLSARSYGAIGDGVADDTLALQAAIDAAVAAQQALYIPGGRYRITAALLLTRGVRIFGAYAEPQVAMFTPAPNTPGNGTWLMLEAAHLVSAFLINPTGAPSNTNQAMGIEIGYLGIYHAQPSPGAGWAPAAYPPAINIPAGSDVNLHDICLFNPTAGIRAVGQSAGRLTIERITGQPLIAGIVLDNQTDTVVVRDVHFWVNWSLDSNVLSWMKANTVALQLGRIDNPVIDNLVCLWMHIGVGITATANGSASVVRLTNCDFDECANPFIISDSVGGHTVFATGCLFGGDTSNVTATSGVTIMGSGTGSQVYLSACSVQSFGQHCVYNVASGGSNHVRIAACQLFQWDMLNAGHYCMYTVHTNSIRCDAGTLTFSINSNTKLVSGGQCIKDPITWITHGVMGATATSVVLPHLLDVPPDMILVSPEGGPSAATEWWGTADASNVTVQVNIAPGSNVNFAVLLGIEN
jgi:hypothetical protein